MSPNMNAKDFIGQPCDCGECRQAGVTDQPLRRDPRTGAWLHGYELKRWYEARDRFAEAARQAVGTRGRHGEGFEKLVQS